MDGNTRICKKCLLREMDEAGFFQNMYDYIARIPADDKTPEEEYERRLSICKECEKLLSGMCRMCGCYVEMRQKQRGKNDKDEGSQKGNQSRGLSV